MAGLELPAWVGSLGPVAGLMMVVTLAIVRGWLIPRSTVETWRADKATELANARADCAVWRGIALERTAQVTDLIRIAQTTERVVAAIPPAVELAQDGGP